MGEVITRPIQCTQCGAAHQVLDDALLVVCEYCGAFVALRSDEHWGGEAIARRHEAQLRALFEPTEADARKTEAQRGMGEAQAAGDRRGWRLWAREYYAMLALTDPELVLGDADDPRQCARWVQHSITAAELGAFDPDVQRAQQRYASAVGELYGRGDPVVTARNALTQAEAFYRVLLEHPEYPRQFTVGDPEHMGRELLRSALVGAATLLGPGVVTQIRREVLGDEAADGDARCRSCGGPLPAAHGAQRCPRCGAVVQLDAEDPWVTNTLGVWNANRARVQDDAAEALLALTLTLSSFFARQVLPAIDSVRAFLAAGPRWLSREDLFSSIELMRQGYQSAPRVVTWLDALKADLVDWEPAGTRPPAPPERAVVDPQAPSATEDPADDPWVKQSLALWKLSRGNVSRDPSTLASTIIGMVLNPFYMGGSISLVQAMAFIDAVEPCPSRAALAESAELMRRGQVAPTAEPLLVALVSALRR